MPQFNTTIIHNSLNAYPKINKTKETSLRKKNCCRLFFFFSKTSFHLLHLNNQKISFPSISEMLKRIRDTVKIRAIKSGAVVLRYPYVSHKLLHISCIHAQCFAVGKSVYTNKYSTWSISFISRGTSRFLRSKQVTRDVFYARGTSIISSWIAFSSVAR